MLVDVRLKVEQLSYEDEVEALGLTDDEIGTVVVYTYDDHSGPKNQPYMYLNGDLRKRSATDRKACFECWGPFLKLFMAALSKLPDVECEVMRGMQNKATVVKQYKIGRPIQWGAFTSTTRDEAVAKGFITRDDGVLLRLHVETAKDIRMLSFIPQEDELLLGPNVVMRASEKVAEVDGWSVLRMVEDSKDRKFYS